MQTLFPIENIKTPEPVYRSRLSKEQIIKVLLQGGAIADLRVRNAKHEAVAKLGRKAFENMRIGKHAILVKKKGFWILSRKMVISLHGRCYAKQIYKKFMKHAIK